MVVRCGLKYSVTRVTGNTRLAELYRTFIPSDGIFNLHRTTIMDSWILFLHTLLSTIAVFVCVCVCLCVCVCVCVFVFVFYQLYPEITIFFDEEMFGSVPI